MAKRAVKDNVRPISSNENFIEKWDMSLLTGKLIPLIADKFVRMCDESATGKYVLCIYTKPDVCKEIRPVGDSINEIIYDAAKALNGPPLTIGKLKEVVYNLTQNSFCRVVNPTFFSNNPAEYTLNYFNIKSNPEDRKPLKAINQFLDRLSDKKAFMSWVGSIFVAGKRDARALWLAGAGGDGKSVIMHAIAKKIKSYSATDLEDSAFAYENVWNKRLLQVNDTSKTTITDNKMFKNITGGDAIVVNSKHEKSFSFVMDSKIVIISNKMPSLSNENHSQRRLMIVKVSKNQNVGNDSNWEANVNEEIDSFIAECIDMYRERGIVEISDASRDLKAGASDYYDDFLYFLNKHFDFCGQDEYVAGGRIQELLKSDGISRDWSRKVTAAIDACAPLSKKDKDTSNCVIYRGLKEKKVGY